jgi:hypothetical protein
MPTSNSSVIAEAHGCNRVESSPCILFLHDCNMITV